MGQARDARLAGAVRRYHTWPTIQQQTDAEHCWNVARILLAIWPDAPRSIIVNTLFHDIGEVAAGDTPYPAKKDDPVLADRLEAAENTARDEMEFWGVPKYIASGFHCEEYAFQLAEFIEVLEFALLEIQLGNKHGVDIIQHMLTHLNLLLSVKASLSADVWHRVQDNAQKYILRRLEEHKRIMVGERLEVAGHVVQS